MIGIGICFIVHIIICLILLNVIVTNVKKHEDKTWYKVFLVISALIIPVFYWKAFYVYLEDENNVHED